MIDYLKFFTRLSKTSENNHLPAFERCANTEYMETMNITKRG